MKSLLEFLINNKSTGIIKQVDEMEFIDFKLDSGNLWGKYNIGAKNEFESGHYYQWGGLEPFDYEKSGCRENKTNWKLYPYANGCNKFTQEMFDNIKDNLCPNGILAKEYDIATKTFGKSVCIPKVEDFDELIRNTTTKYVKNYKDEHACGYLMTSNKDESISMFIPWDKSDTHFLWTSTNDYITSAYAFDCITPPACTTLYKYSAFPIRPIKKIK